jgi:hypothetical protein
MRGARRSTVVAGLVCVPLLAAVPAVAWRLADVLPRDGATWTAHDGPQYGDGPVAITGTVQLPLSPGVSSPIHVTLMNPNPHRLLIRRVKVMVTGISAPSADAAHPCTIDDFEVRQMPRGILRLPAGRAVDLVELGTPEQSWPHLAMRNRALNQDGCQGAEITLTYRAHEVRRGGRS